MCLITKKKNVSIAKRDKTVFKAIKRRLIENNPTWTGPFYNRVNFPFNKVVTARDWLGREIDHLRLLTYPEPPESNYRYIEEGIHSYRVYLMSLIYLNCYSKICVIPEGSEYCYGGSEVVSKDIIVFSSYKKYFEYKWKKLLEKKTS